MTRPSQRRGRLVARPHPAVGGAALVGLLIAGGACTQDDPPLGALAQAMVQVAVDSGEAAPLDEGEVRRELGLLARRVVQARQQMATAVGKDAKPIDIDIDIDIDIAALARAVFVESDFAREVTSTDLRHVLLPHVLADRQGSCVGLGVIYLVLAERLGIPLHGVMVPGHFFVRAQGRNVELLRQGEVMPDGFYRDKYDLVNRAAPAHLRALTTREISAVVAFNVGNERRRAGRWAEATRWYQRAAADFPQFGEAHASLGLVLHLQGQRQAARLAYEAAARVEPNLPGLQQNLAALDAPGLAPAAADQGASP